MTKDIERLNNETQWDYLKRLTLNRTNYDLDYVEWAKLACGYECSSDNARKINYGVKSLIELIDTERENIAIENSDIEEMIFELEMKKLEIQREKIKLQNVKREINKQNRLEARVEIILESLVESLENLPKLEIEFAKSSKGVNEASLLLSDLHIGKGVNTPHNKYDLEIAKERLEKLATQVVQHCQSHNVGILNIDMLGDLIENNLHLDAQVEQVCDAMEQILYAGEYISMFIKLIAPHFNKINLHSVYGNHDRLEKNLKMSRAVETFVRLIDKDIETRTGLKFERSNIDKEIEVYQLLNGKKVALHHGHNLKGGIDKNTMVLSNHLKTHIDYSHIGHFHNFQYSNGTVVNGSLCGSDDYANKLRFNNEASQVLAIYYTDGSQVLHNIVLN